MPEVHIHEDDEGMRNVFPAMTLDEVMDDLAAAQANAEANRAPDGIGWTEIHVVQEPDRSFKELGVKLQRVSDAIGSVLPRIEEFEVGFGANNPLHYRDDAHCFGFGQRVYLKLEADGDYLKRVWFDATSNIEEELIALRRALEAIDEIQPSMIADYWLNAGGLIGDRAFSDEYFKKLLSRASPSIEPIAQNQEAVSGTWWSRLLVRLLRMRSP